MVKIVNDIIIRITLTYGSLIGTFIVLAGIAHLFTSKDSMGACGVLTIGAAMIVGRSAISEFKQKVADEKIVAFGNHKGGE